MRDDTECQLSPEEFAKAESSLNAAIFHLKSAVFFQDMSQHPRWHLEIHTTSCRASKALNAGEPLPLSPDRFDAVLSGIINTLRYKIA